MNSNEFFIVINGLLLQESCHLFWPEKEGNAVDYGNGYSVSLTETEVGDVYGTYRLSVAVDDRVEVHMFAYILHSRSMFIDRLVSYRQAHGTMSQIMYTHILCTVYTNVVCGCNMLHA